MEKNLFPPHGEALRLADYAPRMEQVSDGSIGHGDGHPQNGGSACGCHTHGEAENVCGGCVGYEGCGPDSWGLYEYPLAMSYAPCQTFRGLYDPETALSRGTLFTELDLPMGKEGCGMAAMKCACHQERRPL